MPIQKGPAQVDILQAGGSMVARLLNSGFEPAAFRPYFAEDGNSYIDVRTGVDELQRPVYNAVQRINNANTVLRKDEWQLLDRNATQVFRNRLRMVADLRNRNLVFNMPNGWAHTVLQTQNESDTNDASISMDGLVRGDNDRPEYDLTNLPLPVIHKDFQFTAREIATSRNVGTPLDVASAQIAARKVAELAEKLVAGTAGSFSFGGGSIYGYTNFPSRITKTDLTSPASSGWTQQVTYNEVIAMRQLAHNAKRYGPFVLYASSDWDQYLDAKTLTTTANQMTLRENIRSIDGIEDVRSADYLPAKHLVLVQMDVETVREVVGMDVRTLQWDTDGGMGVNFKVMAIMIPQLRADFDGNCGIVDGSYT